MHTSNFWHFKDAPENPRLVSIALWAPGWYKGPALPGPGPPANHAQTG